MKLELAKLRARLVRLLRPLQPWWPYLALWLLLSLWFARPLWAARVLPLNDLPNHLARITALHHLNDRAWNLSPYYQRSLGLVPYLGHFYVVHLLAYLVGSVVRANLVYMVAYVLAAPLCGLAFARATGKSPWLSLLLLPLAVGYFLQWGFISFCVGAMLVLPACALLYRTLDEPSPLRAVGLVTIALYLCHILPWAAFGAYAFIMLCVELSARRPRPVVWASLVMLPSLMMFWAGLERARNTGYLKTGQLYDAVKDSVPKLFQRTGQIFNLWQQQSIDEWLQVGLVLVVALLVISDAGPDKELPMRKRLRVPLAMLAFLVMALAAPFWVKKPFNWWMINVRFLMLAAAVGVFLPRGPIAGARAALLGVALGASTLLPFYMAKQFKDFSSRAEPVLRLIARTPIGSNTLVLHTPSPVPQHRAFDDPALMPEMALWREIYNYPLVYRGGYDPYLYDDGFPVRRIKALAAPKVESAAQQVWSVDETRFHPETMLHGWDFFIVRADYVDAMPPDGVVQVETDGSWTLYRNFLKNSAPPPPPAVPGPTVPRPLADDP